MLDGSANPDGPGLLVRGHEYEPVLRSELEPGNGGGTHSVDGPLAELDPFVVDALIRMARLAGLVADALRDCPDARVRRSAAVLAARGYPLRAAFDA